MQLFGKFQELKKTSKGLESIENSGKKHENALKYRKLAKKILKGPSKIPKTLEKFMIDKKKNRD